MNKCYRCLQSLGVNWHPRRSAKKKFTENVCLRTICNFILFFTELLGGHLTTKLCKHLFHLFAISSRKFYIFLIFLYVIFCEWMHRAGVSYYFPNYRYRRNEINIIFHVLYIHEILAKSITPYFLNLRQFGHSTIVTFYFEFWFSYHMLINHCNQIWCCETIFYKYWVIVLSLNQT